MLGPDVKEMNAKSVDRRSVLSEAVERLLAAPPVVIRAPVVDKRAKLCERHPLRPVIDHLACS